MPPKDMEMQKHSKTVETGEDPTDFEDILEKQAQMSKNSHDWKSGGCGICRYPRSEHQRFAQKHRLCKIILVFVVHRFPKRPFSTPLIIHLGNRKSIDRGV